MMTAPAYLETRERLRSYFDAEAMLAWSRLTSEAKVSRIRETVRAGRDRMRAVLLDWLPRDLEGLRILDAGCGTGALAVAAAERGAQVVGIDLAGNLLTLAGERAPVHLRDRLEFRSGDMLDPATGRFDHVVLMDSLIHYAPADLMNALCAVAPRAGRSIIFTFAPKNLFLAVFIGLGRLFPRGNRAPFIQPLWEGRLRRALAGEPRLLGFEVARSERVASGFYTSHALELVRR